MPRLCHAYVLPFCEGVQAAQAEKREADSDNVFRALAQALRVRIDVGHRSHMQQLGATSHEEAVWHAARVSLVAKTGHFGVAWA